MNKVLITGITGFIGSNLAATLLSQEVAVVGLKRSQSNISRCQAFAHLITWIDIDGDTNWKDVAGNLEIDSIIHCAWIGVEAEDRNDYSKQLKNIDFLIDLISFCKMRTIEKFIFLGSQAEYGFIEGKVNEDYPANPTSAYGAIKLALLQIFKTFCKTNNIRWFWLRVFSLFGEKQDDQWLFPSVISSMNTKMQMDLTPGEQSYAYLYIKDFTLIVSLILSKDVKSGVYNVSSNQPYQLKTLIGKIRDLVKKDFKLNFGAIPYRDKQSMHIEGDITKLEQQLGSIQFTDFEIALKRTINHYIKS